ncbi:carboxylesterase 5A [Drosophila pseudoobscura]|uniref:Carboxylesterase 5A n=1 Tax=Drosophila pseudoobscura pseudoobscura TaxID=46245 RepID=A0A6I8UUB1_DROPS|nr:carboxylesterase 5A [Drosophila pseudoobscura]
MKCKRNFLTFLAFFFHLVSSFFCIYVLCVDAPFIHIPGNGVISGTYLKMFRTQNIKAYLGIRYAHARRFSPPDIELTPWKGIFNATSFGADCLQNPMPSMGKETDQILKILSSDTNQESGSARKYEENCLYLNVFVPDGLPEINGYAVVVWIHSGDFSTGSPADVNPFQLVFKQKVIVVTFSYRLNIFGFFTTDDGEAQGNYGLMDQAAALYWVKKNINFFGGDTNRITLMGHDAGAISVALHMTSGEWSKGGFHKAIIMSGNPLNSVKLPSDYEGSLDQVSSTFGCPRRPTSMFMQCLKKIDGKRLSENLPSVSWGPVLDFGLSNTSYPFIENQPEILFKRGSYHKVPVIIGVTDMEEVLTLFKDNLDAEISAADLEGFFNDIAVNDMHKLVKNYEWCSNYELISEAIHFMYNNETDNDMRKANKHIISAHTEKFYITPMQMFTDMISKDQHVYSYLFKTRPKSVLQDLPSWINVPKYFDQVFVWGNPYMTNSVEWKSTDKKIAEIIMTLWANFAKTSNPTKSNVYVKWNAMTPSNDSVLLIDENFNTDNLLQNQRINFWKSLYPRILYYSADCCNSTSSGSLLIIPKTITILSTISILVKIF